MSLTVETAAERVLDAEVIRVARDMLRELTTPTCIPDIRNLETATFNVVGLAAAGFSDWKSARQADNVLLLGQHSLAADVSGLENPSIAACARQLADRIVSSAVR